MLFKRLNLTTEPVLKSLLLFSLPILISNVFQQLYNTTDTMIVGNFMGSQALAAVGATSSLFELIVGFAIGVGNGMGIVIARHYGAKEKELVKKSVAGAIVVGVVLTLFIMLISLLLLHPLLTLLQTPENIIGQAYDYIFIIMIFVGVTIAYNLGAGVLRAIGDSMTALYILILAAVFNVILDLLFIVKFQMGVQGAAFATIVAQGMAALLCIFYILRKVRLLIPSKRHFKLDKHLYRDLLGQGISMGLMTSIVAIGSVILQTAINQLGVNIIAAQTAARRIQGFFIMPLNSIALAMVTFVAQNFGAKKFDRIIRAIKISLALSATWSLLTVILFLFSATTMVRWISGSTDTELLANGTQFLHIASLFYIVLGILYILRNTLQGLGEKVIPLISSVIELVGKIIFVAFIIPRLGYLGVILCEPLIWVVMTVQLVYLYRGVRKEKLS
ncbi:MATE family efflux transporter [Streptococcus gallolyticus]|uniref:MATE family multidrug efflux pumps n=3 Tax=Streptococcus gallolyticus TaxID=315405 RepID=A0A139R5B2_9STRE|nr:MATE family efflux transporter [Streptococcus gallolyticus]AQP42767.1 MATE family multidrug efflux pump [Streptococcus gallolyticus subsp. gallolyticus DSM 16831]KXU09903.1 Multi antimicrobial extrusion protein (Na(+)/drug antiporter), MATE family of MDR efflux pump [Streptococcus gallolyticus]MCF0239456.1 MATE family efflux transporter [Streptococcus gallolyticus]MCF1635059.1 MATE family efflux transporter [Streptococcus gallolyticus]MCO7177509.1 MATE family efflux transporter [Streptococc